MSSMDPSVIGRKPNGVSRLRDALEKFRTLSREGVRPPWVERNAGCHFSKDFRQADNADFHRIQHRDGFAADRLVLDFRHGRTPFRTPQPAGERQRGHESGAHHRAPRFVREPTVWSAGSCRTSQPGDVQFSTGSSEPRIEFSKSGKASDVQSGTPRRLPPRIPLTHEISDEGDGDSMRCQRATLPGASCWRRLPCGLC